MRDENIPALNPSNCGLVRAVRAAGMFAWECDLAGGQMRWLGEAAAVIGCTEDDLPQHASQSHFFALPADRATVEVRLARLMAARAPRFQAEFRGLAGQIWHSEGEIDYAPDGSARRLTGITRAVTGPGTAPLPPPDEMRAIYDAAPVGLCVLDAALRFRQINATLAAANGLPVAEHIGRRITDVLPQFKGAFEAMLLRVLEGEEFRGMEINGTDPRWQGEIGTFRVNWLPLRGAGGEVHGVVISGEDITAERKTARTLAEREVLLAAVGASTPDMIYARDGAGRLLYANPAAARVLGAPAEAGRDGAGGEATPPAQDLRVITAGESLEFDETLTDADGRVRVMHSTRAPLRDAGGRVIGVVGVARDVTESRAAETRAAFLHQLSDRLRDDPRAGRVTGEEIGRFFNVSRAGYVTVDGTTGQLTLDSDWTDGIVPSAAGTHQMATFGSWILEVLAQGETLRIEDSLEDPRVADKAAWMIWSLRSLLLSPVLRDGVLVACVFMADALPRAWRPEDVTLLEEVAQRTWAAVEHERALAALRHAEARYRIALSATASVVWTMNPGGKITAPQPGWTAFTGQDWPAQAGAAALRMVHADDRPRLLAEWRRALQNRQNHASEGRVWHAPSRSWRRCLVRAAPIRDAGGQILEWIGALTDIDAQRQAESDLRDSAERLRIAQDAAGLGIFELDLGRRVLRCDARAGRIFGLAEAESHPLEQWLEQICPRHRERVATQILQAGAEGPALLSVECPIVPVGSTALIWIALSGRAIDKGDGVRRLIGSVRDATERRLADETLHALNTRLETRVAHAVAERNRLWSLTDDLLITADTAGRIYEVSESWKRALGWEPSRLLEQNYTGLIHPEDRAPVAERLARLSQGVPSLSYDNRLRAADGSWRMISWRVTLEPGSGRLYGVGRDVTAERAQAEALAAAQAHLHESQKLETLGQLTGGVAHDFNNLLAAITANLEVARNRNTDGAVAPLIEGALHAASRGASLTGRLLAFARRQDLQAEVVRPESLIAGMRDLLNQTVGDAITLRHELQPGLGLIRVDVNQLELAILNLAVNARDAMPEGGVLTIAARMALSAPEPGEARRRHVVLSVSDTGEGMDETTRRRATEPFFTTKEIGRGTGLGLSMVHGLMAQSGGAMHLRSTPGAGTTVELWLPEAEEAAEATPSAPQPPPESARAAPLRVLVVDDDVLVAMGTAIMLEDLGHGVATAHSGAEALRLLAEDGPFDLVITDHAMPNMSGAELAARIPPSVPVILATGYMDLPPGTRAGLPRLGKPFGQAELERAIAQARGG